MERLSDLSDLPVVAAVAAAVLAVAVAACCCGRRRARQFKAPCTALSREEQSARARAKKDRKMYAAGQIRICRFCDVP
eukprot:364288-Prymnesium_polylepis.1